jgi:hypothetical protein
MPRIPIDNLLSVLFLIGFHNCVSHWNIGFHNCFYWWSCLLVQWSCNTRLAVRDTNFLCKTWQLRKPTLIQNHQSFWRCVKCCAVRNVLIHMCKDSIFYTRSTNFLRTGMKSMNRRYSGNCLLSGPVLKLALCQQRWNKAEILESLLKDVAYSQQIPLDKMVEVI